MSAVSASDGPVIVTERLELWLPQVDDMRPMFALISEGETARFLGGEPTLPDHFMRFCRNAGCWQLYGYGMFILRERDGDGSLIGNCGIFHSIRGLGEDFDDRAEAGWILRADCTGKGYAFEAMRAVLDWFDTDFAREVMCLVSLGNLPSQRLAGKLGFQPLREAEMGTGEAVRLYCRPPAGVSGADG